MITAEKHVFISYARADGKALAERLRQSLIADGISAWRDERDLDPYQDFTGEIETAIEQACHVVVCLTPTIAARKDSFVRREILYSQGCGIPITPLLAPGFPENHVPIHIIHLTRLSICDEESPNALDFERGYRQLLDRLRHPSLPPTAPPADDAFSVYANGLIGRIAKFLDSTVYSLLTLSARSADDAVPTTSSPPREIREKRLNSIFSTALPFKRMEAPPTVDPTPPQSFRNIGEAFSAALGQLLLLAEPGAGKTTTLMSFAREALARWQEDRTEPLPLIGRISDWATAGEPPLPQWLAELAGIDLDFVTDCFRRQKVLLLLDGFDELPTQGMPPDRGDRTAASRLDTSPRVRFIEALECCLDSNQALLTCRINDYESLGRKIALRGAATLRPLDDAQLDAFLAAQPTLRNALLRDATLRDIARTPLLLSILTYAYGDPDSGSQASAPERRGASFDASAIRDEIFQRYVQCRFEHEAKRLNAKLEFPIEQTRQLLGVAVVREVDFEAGPYSRDGVPFQNTLAEILGDQAPGFIEQTLRLNLLVRDERHALRFMHALLRNHLGIPVAAHESGPQAFAFLSGADDPPALEFAEQKIQSDGRLPLTVLQNFTLRSMKLVLAAARTLSSDKEFYPYEYLSAVANFQLGLIPISMRHVAAQALAVAAETSAGQARADYLLALGYVGDPSGQEALLPALADPTAEVRGCAAVALGLIGDIRAVEPLRALLTDQSMIGRHWHAEPVLTQRVDQAAQDALQAIGTRTGTSV